MNNSFEFSKECSDALAELKGKEVDWDDMKTENIEDVFFLVTFKAFKVGMEHLKIDIRLSKTTKYEVEMALIKFLSRE